MNSAFRELYLGNISPTELHSPLPPELQQVQHAFREKYDYFSHALGTARPDLKQVYDELCDMDMTLEADAQEKMFYRGLSLGLMFMAEAMVITQTGTL